MELQNKLRPAQVSQRAVRVHGKPALPVFGTHREMLDRDRRRYVELLSLPELDEGLKVIGVRMVLAQAHGHGGYRDAARQAESQALLRIVEGLSVVAKLELCASLRRAPVINTSRARRLVLRTWLRSPELARVALAHRRALGGAFVHAMGDRQACIVRRILSKDAGERGSKDLRILRHEVERWAEPRVSRVRLFESVAWALRARPANWNTPLFAEAGSGSPPS
jgi:hypothetical protein